METEPTFFEEFEKCIKEIINLRKRPLLLMFYSNPAGHILPNDIHLLENVFKEHLNKINKQGFNELDLVIQTMGGEANTSYRLIQLIRSYCNNLNILIPTNSYSGGSLICFGGNVIEMGRTATLSPIDVQLGSKNKPNFALLSIEKYIEFLEDSAEKCNLQKNDKSSFLSELVKLLVKEVSATQLGDLFRLRSLTELHAKTLLCAYMFKNNSDKDRISNYIVSKFTRDSPTHQFEMDINLVKESGLNIISMNEKIYILLKQLISLCTELKRNGYICPFYDDSKNLRMPFFQIFPIPKQK